MDVLVTGAAGGIGRMLTMSLAESGHTVHAVDRRQESIWPPGVTFHQTDIRKRGFDQVLREARPQAVVHLARIRGFELDPALRHRVNFEGAVRVLDASIAAGVHKLVFASRHTVYGALPDQAQFLNEDHPPSAGRTFPEIQDLVAADLYACGAMWRHPKQEIVVLRPVNVVGPQVNSILARYLEGRRVFTVAGYDPVYQLLHERDYVTALILAVVTDLRGVFNVVGPGQLPLSALLERTGRSRVPMPEPLIKVMSGRVGFPRIPQGAIDFLKYPCTVDGSRFVDSAGFSPSVDLPGIIDSIAR